MLPDTARDACRRGVVLAVGQGKPRPFYDPDAKTDYLPLPEGIAVGAVILYGRYASSDTKGVDELKGNIVVDVDSILGVVG